MVKCVEIISLRTAGGTESVVTPDFLFSLVVRAEAEGLLAVRIFSRVNLHTDFSLHLEWQFKKLPSGASPLGLHLAQILKDYGLINHTLWKKEEEN